MCIVGIWSFPCTCNSSFDLAPHYPPSTGQKQNMTKTFFFLSFGAGASVGVSVFFSATAGAAVSGAGAACFCRTCQGVDQSVSVRACDHMHVNSDMASHSTPQPLFLSALLVRLPASLAFIYLFLFRLGSISRRHVSLLLNCSRRGFRRWLRHVGRLRRIDLSCRCWRGRGRLGRRRGSLGRGRLGRSSRRRRRGLGCIDLGSRSSRSSRRRRGCGRWRRSQLRRCCGLPA